MFRSLDASLLLASATFICACLLSPPVSAELTPRLIDTKYPTDELVIASIVVNAPADGVEDATAHIQAAIDEAASAGGAVVFLPEGRYLLKGNLVIKAAVTLRGDWLSPSQDSGCKGTILMPTAGRGDADGEPAITIECGAGLREMTVWYPEQNPEDIVAYPWTIRTSSAAGFDNFTVRNVTLVNAYQAFKTGPEGNELHTLRNVHGTPLKTGVWIDSCTDIGRVVDIDFSPRHWEQSGLPNAPTTDDQKGALRSFLKREGVGIDMGRSDWEFLYGLNVEGYGTGMLIREGKLGTTNTAVFDSRFLDCGTALRLEKLNEVGLAATGCTFDGDKAAVHAAQPFDTVAQFNACRFSGASADAVLLEGKGTLTFQNCKFESWREVALKAVNGSVSALDCDFAASGTHIALGTDVNRAYILSNRFDGEPSIKNEATNGDIRIAHEQIEFAKCDVSRPPAPPRPLPTTREVINVTDHGASPDKDDNTQAFADAMEAARKAGGGTVYVPAGNYRFAGEFTVPSGVELRGCFDVPHHTMSGGSVLMPVAGKGAEDGVPFIRMESESGMRGLLIWYPEQDLLNVTAYPWAVQSLGPKCWLVDVTISNAYQAVDFWTHPSTGHFISYLGGAFLKRGLMVSKSDGEGWVEDVQFNPHYGLRLHESMPRPQYAKNPFDAIIDQQRGKLDGMVFGNCAREHIYRTFMYAAHDGIAFRDDNGGTNARVIMHGTDTGSRCAVLSACGAEGLEFVLAQLVPLGDYQVGAIIVEDGFNGEAAFFASQLWAGDCSGMIAGKGDITIQQMNTISGPIRCQGGRVTLENIVFHKEFDPHITIEDTCDSVRMTANTCLRGELKIDNRLE